MWPKKHTSLRLSETDAGLLVLLLVFEQDGGRVHVKTGRTWETLERDRGVAIFFGGGDGDGGRGEGEGDLIAERDNGARTSIQTHAQMV